MLTPVIHLSQPIQISLEGQARPATLCLKNVKESNTPPTELKDSWLVGGECPRSVAGLHDNNLPFLSYLSNQRVGGGRASGFPAEFDWPAAENVTFDWQVKGGKGGGVGGGWEETDSQSMQFR